MTEFFDTIDTWERELLEKTSTEKVDDVEPQMIVEDDKEPSESFEAIDPSDDGLFQMLSASAMPVPSMSPKKRSICHHPNHKVNSPQRRSMKSRPSSSSESPGLPLDGEGVVSTPKTETRKGKATSGSRSTSRSHGRQEQSEKDNLRSSQQSSGRREHSEKDSLRSSQKSSRRHEQSEDLRSSQQSSGRREHSETDNLRSSQKSSRRYEQSEDLRSSQQSSGRREHSEKDNLRSSQKSSRRHEQSEKDPLHSSQKSSSAGSISTNSRSTTASTNGGRSKSQPRGAATRHNPTHRRERNKVTEGERPRSLSLGRKGHRLSDHGQTQQSRYHKSSSTASSLSRTVHDDTRPKLESSTGTHDEPPTTADPPPSTDDHSSNDDIEDGNEVSSTQGGGKGVVAMLSQGITSAARTTRKEAEKVVKGAAKAVTYPKELARSVGEAATAITTGVMNAAKTTNTESSSQDNQQEELENQDDELNRLDSGTPSVESKRNESMHSPKGTDKRYRERSRMASGEVMSPPRPTNPDLMTKSEHSDKNESGSGSRPIGRMTVRERRHQAAQQRNANRPESQQPKTLTETRSRTITSPNAPPRKTMDRKQSSQSQSSESKISDSSRKNQNDDLPNENDDDWLKARLSRQDDIMMFARKKDFSERKPVSWNGREQETMSELSRSPRTSTGEIKLETSHERSQDQEKKNILTAGAKVAKVALGVTALGAREAINAITNPKKEIEKVVRVSNKAAKKTVRAASNPKETVQKVASITQKISLNVVREATEVTKGTLQLGRDTVQGTVGYVSGLLYDDDEGKEDTRLKDEDEYDSQKLQSRQVNASLVDRVTRVVETSDEKGSNNSPVPPQTREPRRARGKNAVRPGMPDKMPSRMVVNTTGKPNNSWET